MGKKEKKEQKEKLTKKSREGGWFYTEDGMERLRKGWLKGHEAAERSLQEKLGNRHRLNMPLTEEANAVMRSVKGVIPKFQFVNGAIGRKVAKGLRTPKRTDGKPVVYTRLCFGDAAMEATKGMTRAEFCEFVSDAVMREAKRLKMAVP